MARPGLHHENPRYPLLSYTPNRVYEAPVMRYPYSMGGEFRSGRGGMRGRVAASSLNRGRNLQPHNVNVTTKSRNSTDRNELTKAVNNETENIISTNENKKSSVIAAAVEEKLLDEVTSGMKEISLVNMKILKPLYTH